MVPGAQPGTDNLQHYYKELNDSQRTYDPHNLPPINNVKPLKGFAATEEFNSYEQLCQGKQLPQVNKQ